MNNDDLQELKAAATAVENHGVIRSMALPTSEILALISEVEKARVGNGWLPIETAPKDGRKILIYTSDGIIESFWSGIEWSQSIVFADYGANTDISDKPTHWQPLLAAPQ